MIYTFDNYQIDPNNFSIKRNDEVIAVEPRVFDLILYLIANKSQVVSREELFENVWQTSNLLDATLSNHIKTARSILGDDGQSQTVIKTVHGRGYQFIANIKETTNSAKSGNNSSSGQLRKFLSYTVFLITSSLLAVVLYNSQFKQKFLEDSIQNKSIAVLAFLDMSPNKDHEYFSDGISEEILNKLAQIPDLRVISRTSSFYFKNKSATIKEIAKQLKVSYVLEGSVRKQNNNIRITAQLINAKTSAHLWSETYNKTIDDIFQTQDDIAMAVSKKLKLSLLSKTLKSTKVNMDAYSEYLKAKFLSQTNTRENNIESELTIRKSIALDPTYAPAWQFLANNVYTLHYNYGIRSMKTRNKTALYAINKAIELDSDFAPSYAILARVQSQQRQFELSNQNIQKALSLDSNNSYILDMAATIARFSGNMGQAKKYREHVLDINPKYFRNYYNIAINDFSALNFESALKYFKLYAEFKPKSAVTNHMISSVLIAQGEYKSALEYANKEKDGFWKDYIMCMALFAAGEVDEADELLEIFLKERHYSHANIARIYASRGDIEESFKWLFKATDPMASNLIGWLLFPEFRKMHDDPRWHEIVKKMNFPTTHWLVQKFP